MMRDVVTAILGGGQGTRLWPLTRDRAKPAVPIAGKFRLIDIPISNSIYGDITKIYVLTQFNSASLHRHIAQTYRFDNFREGFVNILAAEQSMDSREWFQGTADAVRQMLHRLLNSEPRDVVILSGDQLYLMDVKGFVERHRERDADLTIAVKPVSREDARGLGILRVDESGRLVEFVEKPQEDAQIDSLALDQSTIDRLSLDAEPGSLLASMGIYVFRSSVLRETLVGTDATDFGKQVIPDAISKYRVFGHLHKGYWRDIGTIPGFHQANLELTSPLPALDLYDPEFPIYTRPRFLPGSKVSACTIFRSILSDGTIISGSKISDSVIGIRAIVRDGSEIEQSVIMGASAFERDGAAHRIPIGIGKNCVLRRCIIDLNARIGDGVRLINEKNVEEFDHENYAIRGGIIVIPRHSVIEPGTVI